MCLHADKTATAKLLTKYKQNELIPVYKYVNCNDAKTAIRAPIRKYTYRPGLIETDGYDPKVRREYTQQSKGIHVYLRKQTAAGHAEGDSGKTWIRLYALASSLFGVSKKGGHAVFGTVILTKADYNEALVRLRDNDAYDKMHGLCLGICCV